MCSNMKFNENPSSGSGVITCGWTDMMKLKVAFRSFENAPKNASFYILHTLAKGVGIVSLEQPLGYGMF